MTRTEKLKAIQDNPTWTAQQIADHCGCSKSNICNIASENHLHYASPPLHETARHNIKRKRIPRDRYKAGFFDVMNYAKSFAY